MERYRNAGGDSGIEAFELFDNKIIVQFRKGGAYSYSYNKAGRIHVEKMKMLAKSGSGLNTYINRYVKDLHDR